MDPTLLTVLLVLAVLLPLLLTWAGKGLARALPVLAAEHELQQELRRLGTDHEVPLWRTWLVPRVALGVYEDLPEGRDRDRLHELLRRYQRAFLWRHLLWLGYLVMVIIQLDSVQVAWAVAFAICFLAVATLQLPVYFEVRSRIQNPQT